MRPPERPPPPGGRPSRPSSQSFRREHACALGRDAGFSASAGRGLGARTHARHSRSICQARWAGDGAEIQTKSCLSLGLWEGSLSTTGPLARPRVWQMTGPWQSCSYSSSGKTLLKREQDPEEHRARPDVQSQERGWHPALQMAVLSSGCSGGISGPAPQPRPSVRLK